MNYPDSATLSLKLLRATGLVMRPGRWFPVWVPGQLSGEPRHHSLGAPSCVLKFSPLLLLFELFLLSKLTGTVNSICYHYWQQLFAALLCAVQEDP